MTAIDTEDIIKILPGLKNLTPYWGRIREVQASLEIISNLIPQSLQEGAESWLILYSSYLPQELLILPFPDPVSGYYGQNYNFENGIKHDPSFRIFELIRGNQNYKWYADKGYRNLIENLKHLKSNLEEAKRAIPTPTRFQLQESPYRGNLTFNLLT